MAEPKYIDIKEFREQGYLQEVNRRFLHPLGLALEVTVEDDGTEHISGVWDDRDDPEGIWYDGDIDKEKADHISVLCAERGPARMEALGFFIEPLPDPDG